jgi:addiction module HigA family antidote
MATERPWPDLAIPPGELLAEELAARGMTQSQLARHMGRPLQVVNEIVRGKKRITGETALQLSEALGTSAELWMRLESDYELAKARLARQRRGVAWDVAAASPRRGERATPSRRTTTRSSSTSTTPAKRR